MAKNARQQSASSKKTINTGAGNNLWVIMSFKWPFIFRGFSVDAPSTPYTFVNWSTYCHTEVGRYQMQQCSCIYKGGPRSKGYGAVIIRWPHTRLIRLCYNCGLRWLQDEALWRLLLKRSLPKYWRLVHMWMSERLHRRRCQVYSG